MSERCLVTMIVNMQELPLIHYSDISEEMSVQGNKVWPHAVQSKLILLNMTSHCGGEPDLNHLTISIA